MSNQVDQQISAQNNKMRVEILIDGSNFYNSVLKLMGLRDLDFNFETFAQFLANGRTIVSSGKRFYMGSVREVTGDKKSQRAMAKQNELFAYLYENHWEVCTSKLRFRREKIVIDDSIEEHQQLKKCGIEIITINRKREKGIDVKLATDLLVGAFDNRYDVAIVVSSDGDLVPAIDCVRQSNKLKKQVEYIGFSIANPNNQDNPTTQNLTITKHTSKQRILVESDIMKFIIQKNKTK